MLSLGAEVLKFANTDMGIFILVVGTATTAIGLLKKVLTAERLLKFAGNFNVLTQAVAAGTTAFNVQSAAGGIFSASMYAGAASVEALTKALLASPLFGAAVSGLAIYGIIKAIKTIGKKNCYKCKYYRLYDVCSCGDGERYICTKKRRIDNVVDHYCREHYEKCNIKGEE